VAVIESSEALSRMTRMVSPVSPPAYDRVAYMWCDWCNAEWEGRGTRTRYGFDFCDPTEHSHQCEEGSKYIGAALSARERRKRRGEMFPGPP